MLHERLSETCRSLSPALANLTANLAQQGQAVYLRENVSLDTRGNYATLLGGLNVLKVDSQLTMCIFGGHSIYFWVTCA